MKTSSIRRFVALFLCCQPVLWKSNVALAASLQPGLSVAQDDPLGGPSARTAAPNTPDAASGFGASQVDLDPSRGPGSTSSSSGGPASLGVGLGPGAGAGALGASGATLAPGAPAGTTGLPPIDAAIDPATYVCGPGDVLDLNFWGLQDFRHRTTIDLEGRAFVPRLGFFDLRGKTLSDARRLVREAVARNYPRLSFDLVLANPRTFMVQLVDAVARPGSYPARAVDRVAALLDRTGGLARRGSQRRIEIRRRDGTVLHPDLLLFQQTGDVKYNPYLLDGDVVRVPFEQLAVTVDGAVNRPGRYELVTTKDLSELLAVAGGLSPLATQLLPMSLVRRAADDRQDQRLVDFTLAGPPPALALANEDLLRVPSYAELQRSVVVVGAIAGATLARSKTADAAGVAPEETSATRRMPFVQGDTVRTLLERAGGVGPLADLEGAYIQRGGKSVPVNLHALLMMRDLSADRPIELGDTVVIPFKRRNVLVEGAVFKPGEYPFNPTYGVNEYLSLAGGRNRFALDLSDVRVVTPNGQTLEYRRDLRVDPGSTLVVPERNFSRAEIVQIMISVASLAISGVAVYLATKK